MVRVASQKKMKFSCCLQLRLQSDAAYSELRFNPTQLSGELAITMTAEKMWEIVMHRVLRCACRARRRHPRSSWLDSEQRFCALLFSALNAAGWNMLMSCLSFNRERWLHTHLLLYLCQTCCFHFVGLNESQPYFYINISFQRCSQAVCTSLI